MYKQSAAVIALLLSSSAAIKQKENRAHLADGENYGLLQLESPEDYIKKPDAPVAKKQWTKDNMSLPEERVEIKDPMINRHRTTFYAQSWGVPVTVDPAVMKGTGAETESLGLKMRVGPDAVSVVKRNLNQQLAQKQGVPVLVDPVVANPTGAETESLNIKGRIGPDAVSVA